MDCKCCETASGVDQTLDEMDFERGIWFAAQNDDVQRVEQLLSKGTCPSVQDKAGYSALHYAARAGHIDVCKVLLKAGANVNSVTRAGGATALHRAASQNQTKVLNLLLEWKADPTIRDADGKNILHRAVAAGNIEMARSIADEYPMLEVVKDNKGLLPSDYGSTLGVPPNKTV